MPPQPPASLYLHPTVHPRSTRRVGSAVLQQPAGTLGDDAHGARAVPSTTQPMPELVREGAFADITANLLRSLNDVASILASNCLQALREEGMLHK